MKKIQIMRILLPIASLFTCHFAHISATQQPLKILHLALHKGCLNDFEQVAKELSVDVTSWFIQSDPARFDEYARGNAIYNIGFERANRVWKKHKDYFNQFDVIMTSDTAPLSRIFLQNGWQKPLIIWICNRFDYFDRESLDCNFPDTHYYDLIRNAAYAPNVKIISYTPYEYHYAAAKGVQIGTRTIKPIGCLPTSTDHTFKSAIPTTIDQGNSLFLYPRLEAMQIEFVQQQCLQHGITTYSDVYNGPEDLKNFKGILYFPYQWSNLALFENIQYGFIHFVPSKLFIQKYHHSIRSIGDYHNMHLCEWYCDEFKDLFVYFDSWDDLAQKIKTTDYKTLSTKIKIRAQAHRKEMLIRWKHVFDECRQLLDEQ
jgi:hypothetical protein